MGLKQGRKTSRRAYARKGGKGKLRSTQTDENKPTHKGRFRDDEERLAFNEERKLHYQQKTEAKVKLVDDVAFDEIMEASELTFVSNDLNGEDEERDVLSVLTTANTLGKTPKTFRAWVAKGLIPAPIYSGLDRPDFKYYSVDEVQLIVQTLNDSSNGARFLKAGSTVVRDLANAITELRSK